MKLSLSLEEIHQALKEANISPDKQDEVLIKLQNVAEELKAERAAVKLPKSKNEFGIIIFDQDGSLSGKELYGHVYSVKEGFDHKTILGRISSAIKDSNSVQKKKSNFIDTIGQAFESLKRKFSKAYEFQPKSKQVVQVVISNNKLI